MIFGHDQTSHDIKLTDNVFAYDGCVQVGKYLIFPRRCRGGERQCARSAVVWLM
jgi:hypothetical protein